MEQVLKAVYDSGMARKFLASFWQNYAVRDAAESNGLVCIVRIRIILYMIRAIIMVWMNAAAGEIIFIWKR